MEFALHEILYQANKCIFDIAFQFHSPKDNLLRKITNVCKFRRIPYYTVLCYNKSP